MIATSSRGGGNGSALVDGPRGDAPDAHARIAAIDVLRGVAIAAVVMRHVSWRVASPSSLAAPGGSVLGAIFLASDCGVSLFAALSALTLALRYGDPFGSAGAYLRFLAARAGRLLPAYALWSLVSLAARDVALLASPRAVSEALLRGNADVQFYFVPMVFELYVLWPLLRPLLVRRSVAGGLAAAAGGVFVADLAWRGFLPPVGTSLVFFSASVATGAAFPALAGSTGGAARAGVFGATTAARRRAAAVLAFVAAAALAHSTQLLLDQALACRTRADLFVATMLAPREHALFAAATAGALALVAADLARTRFGSLLAWLGRASYGVFLVHLLLASTVVSRVVDYAGPGDAGALGAVATVLLSWLLTVALSAAATAALRSRSGLAWTVGGSS